MPNDNAIVPKIESLINSMTPALRRVGLDVINNPDDIISKSINDLVERTNTSLGTVVRFCKEIGFDSYGEFKTALTIEKGYADKVKYGASKSDEVIENIFEEIIVTMNTTKLLYNQAQINTIAKKILTVNNIYLCGVGTSSPTTEYIYFKLIQMGLKANVVKDVHYGLQNIKVAKETDMILFISAKGTTVDLITLAHAFKKKDIYSVLISNSSRSPLVDICDETITIGGYETSGNGGSSFVKVNQMFIIEAILTTLKTMLPESQYDYDDDDYN